MLSYLSLTRVAKNNDTLLFIDSYDSEMHLIELKQHLKSKAHMSKVNEKLNRSETVEEKSNDFSLVIPLNLDQTFVEQQNLVQTKFNDEDLINLADNNSFLDDNNVQLIIASTC